MDIQVHRGVPACGGITFFLNKKTDSNLKLYATRHYYNLGHYGIINSNYNILSSDHIKFNYVKWTTLNDNFFVEISSRFLKIFKAYLRFSLNDINIPTVSLPQPNDLKAPPVLSGEAPLPHEVPTLGKSPTEIIAPQPDAEPPKENSQLLLLWLYQIRQIPAMMSPAVPWSAIGVTIADGDSPVSTFLNVFLEAFGGEIDAAILHILNIRN